MKTFFDWMVKTLTGALAVGILLIAAARSPLFPFTVPLLSAGGRTLVFTLPDALGLIVFVCLAAALFYIIGFLIWKAMSVLWSKF
jgi:hypothetical protein